MSLKKLEIRVKRLEEKVKSLGLDKRVNLPEDHGIKKPSPETAERLRNILEWAYEQSVEEKKVKDKQSKSKKEDSKNCGKKEE